MASSRSWAAGHGGLTQGSSPEKQMPRKWQGGDIAWQILASVESVPMALAKSSASKPLRFASAARARVVEPKGGPRQGSGDQGRGDRRQNSEVREQEAVCGSR